MGNCKNKLDLLFASISVCHFIFPRSDRREKLISHTEREQNILIYELLVGRTCRPSLKLGYATVTAKHLFRKVGWIIIIQFFNTEKKGKEKTSALLGHPRRPMGSSSARYFAIKQTKRKISVTVNAG